MSDFIKNLRKHDAFKEQVLQRRIRFTTAAVYVGTYGIAAGHEVISYLQVKKHREPYLDMLALLDHNIEQIKVAQAKQAERENEARLAKLTGGRPLTDQKLFKLWDDARHGNDQKTLMLLREILHLKKLAGEEIDARIG